MSIADVDLIPFDDGRSGRERRDERLRALDRPLPRRRPRLAYALLAVAGAALIGLAQLGVSILTAQGSYELAALQAEERQLTLDVQELSDDVAGLASPQYLAANAAALGMVIDSSPSYLRLSDAKVTGAGEAAGSTSTVDVSGGSAAPNALIADTPLITDPDATVDEGSDPASDLPGDMPVPPAIGDGLPSPSTH
ncbi:hypothetical protein [Microbacterium sp. gxy059]|uniref:hypothetical protein n=1 Tax=Microbacterium sp. gxy059 TaxID=2957199 RepID=UPI003D95179C